ncbi:MAG: gas vesicle protein GvpG [Chloroflexi bacterium]|nr:gas vesicle protein GvpG [Chloroflexota bacterium]
MGMLMDLLTFPLLGPIRGIAWIAARVDEQADGELHDPERVRSQLEVLQLRHELGEVDEAGYAVAEDELLARLAAIREREARGREAIER